MHTTKARCLCGRIAFLEDDPGWPYEVASMGWVRFVNQDTGLVSWVCRTCVNSVRRRPNWMPIAKCAPTLNDGQQSKQVLVWVSKPVQGETVKDDVAGHFEVWTVLRDGGLQDPNVGSPDLDAFPTHWADMPKGPHDKGDEFGGIKPDDHALALYAASRLLSKPATGGLGFTPEEQQAIVEYVAWAALFMPPPSRPMLCDLCGGTDIETDEDVGSDIDDGGEERQHQDTCKACKATRLWADRRDNFRVPTRWWGKWSKDRW